MPFWFNCSEVGRGGGDVKSVRASWRAPKLWQQLGVTNLVTGGYRTLSSPRDQLLWTLVNSSQSQVESPSLELQLEALHSIALITMVVLVIAMCLSVMSGSDSCWSDGHRLNFEIGYQARSRTLQVRRFSVWSWDRLNEVTQATHWVVHIG